MTLTDEQAIAIAQWLEFEVTGTDKRLFWHKEYTQGHGLHSAGDKIRKGIAWFRHWIDSDSGEVAMMDKLDGPEFNWKYESLNGPGLSNVKIWNVRQYGDGRGKTRREALINAILQLLK